MKPRLSPIIVDYPQRSAEWYQARLGNVTGSEGKKTFLNVSDTAKGAAIRELLQVKALSAKLKETPEFLELWARPAIELLEEAGLDIPESKERQKYRQTRVAERLTGMPADPEGGFVTYDMKWGTVNESLAIAKYKLLTGNIVKEAPFMLHPEMRVGASPDGLVTERSTGLMGVIECKCLRSDNHLYEVLKQQKVPEDYMVQIHMEMWISGTDFCDFIGYDSRLPGKLDIFVQRVPRDDEYIDTVLEPEIKRFLDEVQKDENWFRMMARKGFEFKGLEVAYA
jgi:hypothetical protein